MNKKNRLGNRQRVQGSSSHFSWSCRNQNCFLQTAKMSISLWQNDRKSKHQPKTCFHLEALFKAMGSNLNANTSSSHHFHPVFRQRKSIINFVMVSCFSCEKTLNHNDVDAILIPKCCVFLRKGTVKQTFPLIVIIICYIQVTLWNFTHLKDG